MLVLIGLLGLNLPDERRINRTDQAETHVSWQSLAAFPTRTNPVHYAPVQLAGEQSGNNVALGPL